MEKKCYPKKEPPCEEGFKEKYIKSKEKNCCIKDNNKPIRVEKKCEPGKEKNDKGRCVLENCKSGKKKVNGKCVNITKEDIELLDKSDLLENAEEYLHLLPNLDDPLFNSKLANRIEFDYTKYDGTIKNVETESEKLCNAEFELAPHQNLVKNFLSYETPYNNLLLYHGLGSGKTCSAIGVAEEMRDYLKLRDIENKIIIVASPNVQNNFKTQLFDERKLMLTDGIWSIKGCTGNKFLKELGLNSTEFNKEFIVKKINKLINKSYEFFGYTQFANYIQNISLVKSDVENKKEIMKRKLRKVFDNKLIVIDEVHNIRITQDNKNKYVAKELVKLIENTNNIKLLLLSGTPMFNSHEEIIWLINLMNLNDNRSKISISDVFDKNGNFKENGEELLERKATGYISYVRGENPYVFPYRMWPSQFAEKYSIKNTKTPKLQANNKELIQPIQVLDIFMTNMGNYQEEIYDYIMSKINTKNIDEDEDELSEKKEGLGYSVLQKPLEALNMVYPYDEISEKGIETDVKDLVGKNGLKRIMKYKKTSTNPNLRYQFEYRDTKWGNIFSPSEIGKYSGKIKMLCDTIVNSEGIVLVYSQYIDGGVVPVALALEELGFTRAGLGKTLLKNRPNVEGKNKRYVMITGDPSISPNNNEDIKLCTNVNNKNGEEVKVILISQAGSEGLDFKFIRQVHILEPWYNMNRVEQIIGRAIRTCSHKDLSFKKRNVEIYLHGTNSKKNVECVDIYVYRKAEKKSIIIGNVSRLLKEIAMDCILNKEQTNFTEENMNQIVDQELSSGITVKYRVGDKPYSLLCDYKEKCEYDCKITKKNTDIDNVPTYRNATSNNDEIKNRIQTLMKERFFYMKDDLLLRINVKKQYPEMQINFALTELIENEMEFISDMYGRLGNLINIGNMYLFQPIELNKKNISVFNRKRPVDYKIPYVTINPKNNNTNKYEKIEDKEYIIEQINMNYNFLTKPQALERGDSNWYKFCNYVIKNLVEEGESREKLLELAIHHIIETMSYDNILYILNYLETKSKKTEVETYISNYFDNEMLKTINIEGIILSNKGDPILLIRNGKEWKTAEGEDTNDLKEEIKKKLNKVIPLKEKFNDIFGYMAGFKQKEENIFKIRQTNKSGSSGQRCDQSGKSISVKILNKIIGENKYSTKNIGTKVEKMPTLYFCVLQEMILRLYDSKNKNGKRWFMSISDDLLTKIGNGL
tara:strand:- start:23400 stop:27023 length:3624 start_codon:yes stop_codon:yes gene_type:complete